MTSHQSVSLAARSITALSTWLGEPPTCLVNAARVVANSRASLVRWSSFASICGREYGPICATVMRQGSPETSNDASLYYADSCVAFVML